MNLFCIKIYRSQPEEKSADFLAFIEIQSQVAVGNILESCFDDIDNQKVLHKRVEFIPT